MFKILKYVSAKSFHAFDLGFFVVLLSRFILVLISLIDRVCIGILSNLFYFFPLNDDNACASMDIPFRL